MPTRLPPKYLNSVGEIIDIERILPNNSTLRYAHFVYHDRVVSIKAPDAVSSNSSESMNTVMASNTNNILMPEAAMNLQKVDFKMEYHRTQQLLRRLKPCACGA